MVAGGVLSALTVIIGGATIAGALDRAQWKASSQARPDATAIFIPRDVPDYYPTPTPTPNSCQPRGSFIPGTRNIQIGTITIPNNMRVTLDFAIDIVEDWVGCTTTSDPSRPDIEYSIDISPDDGLIHSVRYRPGDVNVPQPHFNLEAGIWGFDHNRLVFNRASQLHNLHLYFVD